LLNQLARETKRKPDDEVARLLFGRSDRLRLTACGRRTLRGDFSGDGELTLSAPETEGDGRLDDPRKRRLQTVHEHPGLPGEGGGDVPAERDNPG
jgi:hypothetical protein